MEKVDNVFYLGILTVYDVDGEVFDEEYVLGHDAGKVDSRIRSLYEGLHSDLHYCMEFIKITDFVD